FKDYKMKPYAWYFHKCKLHYNHPDGPSVVKNYYWAFRAIMAMQMGKYFDKHQSFKLFLWRKIPPFKSWYLFIERFYRNARYFRQRAGGEWTKEELIQKSIL